MKITRVTYSALVNLGDYSNEKIELTADLDEGETVETVVDRLKEKVFQMVDRKEMLEERRKLRYDLRDLKEQIEHATEHWNRTRDFLVAQGLRPDAPEMPIATKLLTHDPKDVTEFVHAEIIE